MLGAEWRSPGSVQQRWFMTKLVDHDVKVLLLCFVVGIGLCQI